MGTNDILLLKHKMKYIMLSNMISSLRYQGKDVPLDLVLQAENLGRLARVPDKELNDLLFNCKSP
jgi:hypothetical protein